MDSVQQLLQNLREGDGRSIQERAEKMRELAGLLNLEHLWDIFPDFGSYASSQDIPVLEALEEFTQELWRQALRCYVDSSYLGCIVLCSFAIESALKHMLKKTMNYSRDSGLGSCINLCQKNNILPQDGDNAIVVAAWTVNGARGDIVHANIPRRRPESILYSEGAEHEVSDIGIVGIQRVEPFRNMSRDTIINTKKVLDYLSA